MLGKFEVKKIKIINDLDPRILDLGNCGTELACMLLFVNPTTRCSWEEGGGGSESMGEK